MMERNRTPSPGNLLFKPFIFIAGGKALLTGVAVLLAGGVLCYFSNCHFDGLLDAHFGSINRSPIWIYLSEGFINWLIIALFITVSARLITKSRYRAVDVFGTLALARAPYLITALITLLPGARRYAQYIGLKVFNTPVSITPMPTDIYIFYAATIISLLMTIWSVLLMYRAFSLSCNARGKKAVFYFTIIVLLSEVVSKLAIAAIAQFGTGGSAALKGFA